MKRRVATGRHFVVGLLNESLRHRPIAVVYRAVQRTVGRDFTHMSAGIAYFAILSLFPLLIATVSVASLLFDPDYVTEQLVVFLGRYMPVSTELVERNVQQVIRLRGPLGVVGLLMLVWSGSALFSALARVTNRVWGIEKGRPFYIEKLRNLALILTLGVLFAVSVGFTVFIQVGESIEVSQSGTLRVLQLGMVQTLAYAAAFMLTVATFLLAYRFLPNAKVDWLDIWPGAVIAAALFELLKAGFVVYLRHFANPELLYGSLSSVALILLWCYLSAHIFIFGAALSAEYRVEKGCRRQRRAKAAS